MCERREKRRGTVTRERRRNCCWDILYILKFFKKDIYKFNYQTTLPNFHHKSIKLKLKYDINVASIIIIK